MTEEIYGATWQDNVIALAMGTPEVALGANGTATLQVYAVFGGSVASRLINNADLTFAIETNPASTTTGVEVGTNTGVITASSATNGACVVSATLTGHENVPPALATVTITAG